jgi:uncharacterized protein (TIRG00374 family)
MSIIGACGVLLVLAAVVLFTRPWNALGTADLVLVLAAGILCIASSVLRSATWVYVLMRSEPCINKRGAVGVSMVSLIGTLTPLNVGTDVLRSLYGKGHLGLEFEETAAASVVTRTLKTHSSLLLLVAFVALISVVPTELTISVVYATGALVLLLLVMYSAQTGPLGRLAKRVHIGDISAALRKTNRALGISTKGVLCGVFCLGFALDWVALYLCFVSVGISATPSGTFFFFVVLHCLARVPILPQGTGIVEAGGFTVLRNMDIEVGDAGALLLVWGAIRILVPLLLAVVFTFDLRKPGTPNCRAVDGGVAAGLVPPAAQFANQAQPDGRPGWSSQGAVESLVRL